MGCKNMDYPPVKERSAKIAHDIQTSDGDEAEGADVRQDQRSEPGMNNLRRL